MDSNDIEILNDIYNKILRKGKSLHDKFSNIKQAQDLESYATYLRQMNIKLEKILQVSDNFVHECIDKATEVREICNLQEIHKDNPFPVFSVHKEMYENKYKNMNWADITKTDEKKEKIITNVEKIINHKKTKDEFKHTDVMYKKISELYDQKLDINWTIPIINNLNDIPPSIYWFDGNKKNPKGVYACISKDFYVQIPLPNVIDSTKDFNRICSVKCKYGTHDECLQIRKELADRYNSKIRPCNFAHQGDKYSKIGTTFRCPSNPRFGNLPCLKNDISTLQDTDMKMMLMYSLSDMLLSSMWFQNNNINKLILTDIDICE